MYHYEWHEMRGAELREEAARERLRRDVALARHSAHGDGEEEREREEPRRPSVPPRRSAA